MLQHTYGGQKSQVCGHCLSSCGNIQIVGCGCKQHHPLSHLASPKERFLLHRSKSHDLEKLKNLFEVTQLAEASGFKWIVVVAAGISPDPACEFCMLSLIAHLLKPVESFLLGGENLGL